MPELVIARKINSLDEVVRASKIGKKKAHPTKSVAGPNQTPTIPDRKRTECPLPHAVGF